MHEECPEGTERKHVQVTTQIFESAGKQVQILYTQAATEHILCKYIMFFLVFFILFLP